MEFPILEEEGLQAGKKRMSKITLSHTIIARPLNVRVPSVSKERKPLYLAYIYAENEILLYYADATAINLLTSF